jgi:hypothetical protein
MNPETLQYIITNVMILATLLCAYLGVRLVNKSWPVRMSLIGVPLLLNAVLYAIYGTTHFFYLGIILLICIPFVWPRKSAS